MSSASPLRRRSSESPSLPDRRWVESLLVAPVRAAGFWSAVSVPFVLLGVVASGSVADRPGLLGALLVVNLVGLWLGQGYNRE